MSKLTASHITGMGGKKMDYKELIELSKKAAAEWQGADVLITSLCDAIETLLAEREAAEWKNVEEELPKEQGWFHIAILDKVTGRYSVEQDLFSVETAQRFGHDIGFCKSDRWPERKKSPIGHRFLRPLTARGRRGDEIMCDNCGDVDRCPFYESGADECVYEALMKAAHTAQDN